MLRRTMTVARRKRLLSIGTIGTLLTLLVMLTDALGGLDIAEQQLHDLRARRCQFYTPPPTNLIAHIDIDDGALASVGRWPWSRTRMADLVDEMNVAGAKLIVLDIVFSEPTPKPGEDQSFGTPVDFATTSAVSGYVDPDERLAEAFRRRKNVVVAASLTPQPADEINAADIAAVKVLTDDLELEPQDVVNRLAEQGLRDTASQIRVLRGFVSLRGEAMRRRINQELEGGRATTSQLIDKLLPKAVALGAETATKRQVREELEHVLTIRAMRRFAATAGSDTPALLSTHGGYPPIAKLASAAAYGGFVDYLPARDGVVRRIPLACWHEQSIMPAMGLVAACATMGVDIRDVRFTRESVVIPRPQGDLVIPTLTQPDGPFAGAGAFLEVPLFGKRTPESPAWERMYDYPKYEEPKARVGVLDVVAACSARFSLEKNEALARHFLGNILELIDPSALDDLKQQPPTGDELFRRMDDALETLRLTTESLAKLPDRKPEEQAELKRLQDAAFDAKQLVKCKVQRPRFEQQLVNQRAKLVSELRGKVVFVGSTATGAADFVRSSLDATCPGVYLHGAAFNAIMTGQFLYTAKPWVTVLITLAIGLLTTLAVAFLSPMQAFAAVLLIAGGYAALNGVYLFDKHDLIVGAAGPLVCAGVVWSGVTLIQFIREVGERTRLTRRFSSYVDPTLVNYVVENPEQARLEAHEKVMTVCFTDLQGFTTLAEKLRAQSAKMLGQYMEAMVPLIRARRGYVNKFLGDGIMFFFGAPVDNPDHAADAVAVVLDMQRVMVGFNENLAKQNLPTLSVRAGVSTGSMVVGDAGPSFASDYTVLGDSVNLASRIESANKAFGTSNLVTAQTVDLLNGRYLVRPVANVLVVGKHESVLVYEAIAPMESATEEQKRIAAVTTEMFEAFAESRWDDCERALSELERLTGATKMIARYREEVAARRGRPTEETFRGQIQLFAK
jgi:class 3 adenylate cyclase/CHASE2 domain-containing sensor protein